RRMGIPSLQVAADNLNGDQYPVRYRYPQTEQAANNAHRLEAAGRIGGDTYNSPGWWEQ
ncbi:MAG TPA: SusD/RagB family nutrient-binding outer membrane lipoprotein, partial [Cryomorphaceae bacterium]|nr:SusD/RagB family nutrient-binding outer membrane lipoprotein [Cryomorphaceae bacterium]